MSELVHNKPQYSCGPIVGLKAFAWNVIRFGWWFTVSVILICVSQWSVLGLILFSIFVIELQEVSLLSDRVYPRVLTMCSLSGCYKIRYPKALGKLHS